MANKWVYMFSEGDMTMRNLLGGKGAGTTGIHNYNRSLYTVL